MHSFGVFFRDVVVYLLFPIVVVLIGALGRSYLDVTLLPEHYVFFEETLVVFGVTLLCIRLLNLFYLGGVYGYKRQYELPILFKNMIFLGIWIAAGIVWLILRVDDFMSYMGLFTTSSVMLAIIGFAVRNLVADFFAGITLGIEMPFYIGEWIEPEPDVVGRVVELNWRSTQIVTRDNITINIPNSRLASVSLRNYNRPDPYFRVSFEIILDYDVTTYQAERLLLGAVNEFEPAKNAPNKADLRIKSFDKDGIVWLVRFWINDYALEDQARYTVQKNILRNLHYAKIEVPTQRLSLVRHDANSAERSLAHLLREAVIFKTLTPDELARLAATAKRHLIPATQTIFAQGDAGSSLYMISEGLVSITVRDGGGVEREVAALRAGTFFGENSFLTGDPRSASATAVVDTVLYEITKEALGPILEQNMPLVGQLSEVMVGRQMATAMQLQRIDEAQRLALLEQQTRGYANKILMFFNLNPELCKFKNRSA